MSISYEKSEAKLVESITGKTISVNGFVIPEDLWLSLDDTPTPTKDILSPTGWSNVQSGQIVGLIDSESTKDTASLSPIEETDPDKIELITDSLYRVIGLSMSESDEPFIFTIFLESPSDKLIVIFSGSESDQESGIWSIESEERIHDSCGCGVVSDKIISKMFDSEGELLSHNI